MKSACSTALLLGMGMTLGGFFMAAELPAQDSLRIAHNAAGEAAIAEGDYSAAARSFRLAMRESETIGIQDVVFADSVLGLARSFEKLEQFREAESHYARALILHERFSGEESTSVGKVLRHLAKLCEVQGKDAEATSLIKQAAEFELPAMQEKVESDFANEKYESAKAECVAAIAIAQQAHDSKSVAKLEQRLAIIEAALKVRPLVNDVIDQLGTGSEDPEASLLLGRYLCILRQDWSNGVSVLAQSGDNEFRLVALAESQRPKTSDKQLELANSWFEMAPHANAGERVVINALALKWYQAAQPGLPAGLSKVTAQRRIRELSAQGVSLDILAARTGSNR